MQNSEVIWDHVEAQRDAFIGLSDRVFDTPETLYNEYRSVAEHRAMLKEQGFRITDNAAGIPPSLTITYTPPCAGSVVSAEVVRLGTPANPAALLGGG